MTVRSFVLYRSNAPFNSIQFGGIREAAAVIDSLSDWVEYRSWYSIIGSSCVEECKSPVLLSTYNTGLLFETPSPRRSQRAD